MSALLLLHWTSKLSAHPNTKRNTKTSDKSVADVPKFSNGNGGLFGFNLSQEPRIVTAGYKVSAHPKKALESSKDIMYLLTSHGFRLALSLAFQLLPYPPTQSLRISEQ